jgi:hypothetical protein
VQFISDLVYGDAASTDLVQWRRTFRNAGIDAPVHAHRFDAHHADACAPLEAYEARPGDVRLFHYTTWTPAAEFVLGLGRPLVLMYHNVTPPSFFAGLDPEAERATARGRAASRRAPPWRPPSRSTAGPTSSRPGSIARWSYRFGSTSRRSTATGTRHCAPASPPSRRCWWSAAWSRTSGSRT